MSDLPAGWATAFLPQMVASGGVFSDGDWVESKDQDPEGDVRLIQLADVGEGYYRDRSSRFLTMTKARELGCTFLQAGDVLIARMPDPLGRACIFPGDSKVSVTVVDVCVIRLGSGGVNSRWLMYALNAPESRNAIEALQKGTTRKRVSRGNLAVIPFPVPPLAEQERIVAAIEEEFSRLDAGVEALESARLRIEQFAKAVLVAAIPEPIPATWRLTTVEGAGRVQLGRQRSPQFHTGPNMKPYLRVANVFEDRIDTTDVMTMQFSEAEFRQYRLEPDDILLNEGQSPHLLGRPAMYRGDPPEVAFTNSLLRFRAGEGVLPAWALLVFRRHLHARRFMAESQITTNIAHLSAGRFKRVEFPIPPVEDQSDLIAWIDDQLSVIEIQRAAVARGLARARQLRSAILAAAFSGRLVPQDPKEEPASVLLDRMAATRTFVTGHKPTRSRKLRSKVTA
jgi:type I restriction enzyme S subunit